MNWPRGTTLVPVFLGTLSLWLPWVAHPAAALVLTGLDVPEFVRFMGSAGAPLVTPCLIAFAAPLLSAALVASLAVGASDRSLWFRGLVLVGAVWLVSVAFSPLERRLEFLAGSLVVAAVWAGATFVRPGPRLVEVVALAAGATAPGLAVAQFLRAAPALGTLYGRAITWGAGAYLAAATTLLAAVWLGATLVRRPVAAGRQRM